MWHKLIDNGATSEEANNKISNRLNLHHAYSTTPYIGIAGLVLYLSIFPPGKSNNSQTINPTNYIQPKTTQEQIELQAFDIANRNEGEHPKFGGQYLDSAEQKHYNQILNDMIEKTK